MALKSFSFKTKDGVELWVNRWIPDATDPENPPEIKAVIVFNHGLAEHSLRYDRFGSILSENGYVFTDFDMRGHGRTAAAGLPGQRKYPKLRQLSGNQSRHLRDRSPRRYPAQEYPEHAQPDYQFFRQPGPEHREPGQ